MDLQLEVQNRLKSKFWESVNIDFHDEKWDWKHFYLFIVSELFDWLSRIERSREVHSILDDLMKDDYIHALRLRLKSPKEI